MPNAGASLVTQVCPFISGAFPPQGVCLLLFGFSTFVAVLGVDGTACLARPTLGGAACSVVASVSAAFLSLTSDGLASRRRSQVRRLIPSARHGLVRLRLVASYSARGFRPCSCRSLRLRARSFALRHFSISAGL